MLNFLKKVLTLSLALPVILTACAKKPETPLSPSVKIAMEKRGEDKIFAVTFTCSLMNENDSTALTNIDGIIAVKDNESGAAVLTVPVKMPVILPFKTMAVQERIELTADQINPLLDFIDKQQKPANNETGNSKVEIKKSKDLLESGGEVEEFFKKQNVLIEKLTMEEMDIIKLLRSKL